ncbi:MAG: hypothetical protein ACRC2T_20065 [Thermoguttaceae bacterium]
MKHDTTNINLLDFKSDCWTRQAIRRYMKIKQEKQKKGEPKK